MGSQWSGMGKKMMQFPVFESSMRKCADVLKRQGVDLFDLMFNQGDGIFDNILNAFVCMTSIQVSGQYITSGDYGSSIYTKCFLPFLYMLKLKK